MRIPSLITTKKVTALTDDLQVSIKCPTSEEQKCEQEAAADLDSFIFQH